jgi:hypothetical protein
MLTRLDLQLFKCFELLRLPLGPLTLLSGGNASGKSSVLQALVLLHQTMREHEWSTRLILNGAAIRMGTVADVVDKLHGRGHFDVDLFYGERQYGWIFQGDRSEMSMRVVSVAVGEAKNKLPGVLRYLLPPLPAGAVHPISRTLRGLTYITAERVGPREVYKHAGLHFFLQP